MTESAIAIRDDVANAADLIASFQNPDSTVFSTLSGDTFEEKLAIVSSMTNAKNLRDNLGKVIELVGWTAQTVDLTDEKTGEMSKGVRIVLMDAKGVAWACVSGGIAKSLSNLLAVLGEPKGWPQPVKVRASEEQGKGMNRYLTLTLA